jgi:DNA invertase Pin-like site-specific DNA recombinase
MACVGYARVSSLGQSLDVQRDKLLAAGAEKLFEEKRSGVDAKRPVLLQCLNYLREGDTLLVTKVDRVARSAGDFYAILQRLKDQGAGFKAIDDPDIDTTSRSGKLLVGILALIAEFENDIRRERQMDGIAKARANGVKFGRKAVLTPEIIQMIGSRRDMGDTVPEIVKATKLSKATVYRALARRRTQEDAA